MFAPEPFAPLELGLGVLSRSHKYSAPLELRQVWVAALGRPVFHLHRSYGFTISTLKAASIGMAEKS